MVRAVIFDMDGVLIDSVGMNWQAYNAVLKEDYGKVVEPGDIHKYVGRNLPDQIAMLNADLGIEIDPESFGVKTIAVKKELFQSLQPMSGVKELLEDLKAKGIPIAIGTSSDTESTKEKLEIAGLLEYFDVIVTSDHVTKHKPEPDVYLECAKQLGVDPEVSVVVEDAPAGVESAHRAGMRCLAVETVYVDKDKLRDADMITESLVGVRLETFVEMEKMSDHIDETRYTREINRDLGK